jgi:hypothetical protein
MKSCCRNVPVAEVAEIDGHRQAQPLRGYFSIDLTLRKKKFSDIDVQSSDTSRVFIGDLAQCIWIDVNILPETHSNYLTHKLCCSEEKLIYR